MPFSQMFEKESVQMSGTGPFKRRPNLDIFWSFGATLSKIVYDPFTDTKEE